MSISMLTFGNKPQTPSCAPGCDGCGGQGDLLANAMTTAANGDDVFELPEYLRIAQQAGVGEDKARQHLSEITGQNPGVTALRGDKFRMNFFA